MSKIARTFDAKSPEGCRAASGESQAPSAGGRGKGTAGRSGVTDTVSPGRPGSPAQSCGARSAGSTDCVIGIGANLGARRDTMCAAVQSIGRVGSVLAVSNLYETDAVGPPQPDYLNAAVRVVASLAPSELLVALLAIEKRLGRVRRQRWGARTLDLDLLWIDGVSLDLPALKVPHPRLGQRAFAILPLLDVAPAAADPSTGMLYASLVERLDVAGVRQVEGASWARGSLPGPELGR